MDAVELYAKQNVPFKFPDNRLVIKKNVLRGRSHKACFSIPMRYFLMRYVLVFLQLRAHEMFFKAKTGP